MNFWQVLTKTVPLEEERDILARIGLRFLWCTGPYFLFVIIWFAFVTNRNSPLTELWPSLFFLAIPFLGGLNDWRRLKRQVEQLEA